MINKPDKFIPEDEPASMPYAAHWIQRCREFCEGFLTESRKIWIIIGLILLTAVLWIILANFGLLPAGDFPWMSGSKWQAVFLTNGQVYFGHIRNYNHGYVLLKDVYYLQVAQPLQQGQQAPANLNLVKLGGELHGPEDAMFIPKTQVLFWENMKPESQVVKGIESTRK